MSFPRPSGRRAGANPSTAVVLRSSRIGALRSARRGLLAGAGVLAAALLAAQLLLPALAERQARSALGSQASGVHVDIQATPAIKLLWHRADRVKIDVDRLTPETTGGGSVGEMLSGLRVARKIDLHVGELRARGVRLHGVTLHKDGDVLVGRAGVDLRSLEGSLPAGLRIRPLSGADDAIPLEGSIAPLGQEITARATLSADRGRIVVRPEGVPLIGSLVTIPVFSDDRIGVDRLGARPAGDGMVVTARAHLRDA
jgi:hypothetical protein